MKIHNYSKVMIELEGQEIEMLRDLLSKLFIEHEGTFRGTYLKNPESVRCLVADLFLGLKNV